MRRMTDAKELNNYPMRMKENDPRYRRTRQLILNAFNSLSTKNDFKNITIREIAEQAGVNRGTFYAHFTDIYALVEYIIDETFREHVSKQLQGREHLTIDTLRDLIIAVCNFHEQMSESCRRTAQAVLPLIEMKVKEQIAQMISDWLDNVVTIHKDMESLKWTAVIMSQAIYGSANQWNANGRETDAAALADEIMCLLMPGLQGVLGKKIQVS